MVCRAEGATVAPQGITAWTTWCGEQWRRQTFRRWAVRPAWNWWEATWRSHTAVVETRKVRHVGRHSERHTGSVIRARDVPDSRRSSRSGSRKEKKQVLLTKPIVLVCSNRGRNEPLARTGWTFCANLEGASHKVQMTTARAPSSFSAIRFNSTLQCGRCFGYLRPHNTRGRNIAVPALF